MATTSSLSALPSPNAEGARSASLQPNLIGHAKRPEYIFIHTVRFWCIVAIVLMHSAFKFIPLPLHQLAFVVQPFKFGTIGFFLISGFLLGDRLPAADPFEYLGRRARRLAPAWLFWYGLQTVCAAYRDLADLARPALSPHLLLNTLSAEAGACLTGTALWFVPNFMVALTCVVLCRKWLDDLRMGAIFLAANLFYSVNVYTCWIPSRHTEAVFGFVFYLWLGAWCALRKQRLERWAASVSNARLLTCIALATVGGLVEAHVISVHHGSDPLNSLRFCNQIFSILVVIALVRIRRVTWPRSINVAETTYGIYLTHSMVLALVYAAAAPFFFNSTHNLGCVSLISIWVVLAPISYAISLFLTRSLAACPWPWIVGATRRQAARPAAQLAGSLQSATSAS